MTEASADEPFVETAQQREAAELGMWIFLATEVLFFGTLFVTFTVGRFLHREAFLTAARETDVAFGTINTAILLTSSLTAALAAKAAELRNARLARGFLLATIALALAFLIVKGFEYKGDFDKHLVPGHDFGLQPAETQIFWSLYWIMTGVHAIHVTTGIGVFVFFTYSLKRRWLHLGPAFTGLEVPVLYWHFVDLVWIFLYPLLYLAGRAQ